LEKKVNDVTKINDTRKAELLSQHRRAYRHHQVDARLIVEAMGKMSFTSRDLAPRHRHLQPDAERFPIARHPG
jgi:deoxyhypusine synthase